MRSIKPGRGPSAMGAIVGIGGVIFGIFWTIMAFAITRHMPFPLVGIVFPAFGVVFVVIGIINVFYNLTNATQKNRFSTWDITAPGEEPDPLNVLATRPKQHVPRLYRAEENPGLRPDPAHGNGDESIEDRLRKLDGLRAKGLLTEAEYSTQRQRILAEI